MQLKFNTAMTSPVVAEVLHKRHIDNPTNGDAINRDSSADRKQGLPTCVFLKNFFGGEI